MGTPTPTPPHILPLPYPPNLSCEYLLLCVVCARLGLAATPLSVAVFILKPAFGVAIAWMQGFSLDDRTHRAMESLPVRRHKDELWRLFSNHQMVIISADTGTGKSLVIPDILWQVVGADMRYNGVRVCCSQPRVTAAFRLAQRKAEHMGGGFPGWVGFEGGSRKMLTPGTTLIYATTGTIVLKDDDTLRMYDGIVLDECHERSEDFELLLLKVLAIIPKRPNFKVVLSSADTTYVQSLFPEIPFFRVPGRSFPIRDLVMMPHPSGSIRAFVKEAIAKAVGYSET